MRRLTAIVAFVVAGAVTISGAVQQAPPPTFRALADLISVDAQVVDADGRPVEGLGRDEFEVNVDGRRRRVVSVEFIDHRQVRDRGAAGNFFRPEFADPAIGRRGARGAAPADSILAIDCGSFDEATAKPVTAAAAAFISRLPADDEVGLVGFPIGPTVDPTTDHAAVLRALDGIVAQRDAPPPGEFNLSASDLVELSTWVGIGASSEAAALVNQLCGAGDAPCRDRLRNEVMGSVLYDEGMARVRVDLLRSLVADLSTVPNRKTVVLVSAGLVAADRPGARPDNSGLVLQIGKAAAQANVNVYTLFIDQSWLRQQAAETRRARNRLTNVARDSAILGRLLEQFSGAAGGSFVNVMFGGGESAFNRVLRETSAYYLLGVEPAADNRDGRLHALRVRTRAPGVSVRGRSWVLVPSAWRVRGDARRGHRAYVRTTPARHSGKPRDSRAG